MKRTLSDRVRLIRAAREPDGADLLQDQDEFGGLSMKDAKEPKTPAPKRDSKAPDFPELLQDQDEFVDVGDLDVEGQATSLIQKLRGAQGGGLIGKLRSR